MSRKAVVNERAGFPLLAPGEILDCIQALGLTVHPDDLTRPTPMAVRTIWTALLDSLMDISPEMIEEPMLAVTESMPYPEMYQDTIGTIMFYSHW